MPSHIIHIIEPIEKKQITRPLEFHRFQLNIFTSDGYNRKKGQHTVFFLFKFQIIISPILLQMTLHTYVDLR